MQTLSTPDYRREEAVSGAMDGSSTARGQLPLRFETGRANSRAPKSAVRILSLAERACLGGLSGWPLCRPRNARFPRVRGADPATMWVQRVCGRTEVSTESSVRSLKARMAMSHSGSGRDQAPGGSERTGLWAPRITLSAVEPNGSCPPRCSP